MRISESEHKLIVNERNRLKDENARLVDIIQHHYICANCIHDENPTPDCCKQQPCSFELKPVNKKKPWPKCEKCGEPVHPCYPCADAKLLRLE